MPTYSYRCENCNHTFDLFQRITADPEKMCPKCKEPKLKRLIGAGAGLIFKGSGFYITDYRSKSYQEKAKSEASSSSSTSSSSSKSSSKSSSSEKKSA